MTFVHQQSGIRASCITIEALSSSYDCRKKDYQYYSGVEHFVILTGLVPGTIYYYKVGSKTKMMIKIHKFTAPF